MSPNDERERLLAQLATLTRMIGRIIGSGDSEAIELFTTLLAEKASQLVIMSSDNSPSDDKG